MTSAAPPTRSLGRYRLIGQIGEGGMGVVYLASGSDERRVAVKVLRPSIVGDAHGRARLAREVTSLRRVRSPRIAEIYDADPWGDTPYVVMRYVPGPSLRDVVEQRGVLTGPALGRFALGLAEALVVVHEADVLHRDVKPSNVLIEEGQPVLIDFGLAQLADDLTLTQTGWLMGTPGYLAPEILYGDPPTPAADVHAWAATVTYAATGRGPYGGGPSMAVLDRARRGESDLTHVPTVVADVVAAALRPDPSNRPTARQIVDWVGNRLTGTPASLSVLTGIAPRPGDVAPIDHPDEALVPLPLVTAVQPAAQPAPRRPPVRSPARRDLRRLGIRGGLVWTSVLTLVVTATIAAPIVALASVMALGWALQTLSDAHRRLTAWRTARGARRHDEARVALMIPWLALRALLPALASAAGVLFVAAPFVVLGRFGPDQLEQPSLAAAGLVAAGVLWFGPAAQGARDGAIVLSASLPRSRLALAVVVLLLISVASGLLATTQITGTTYIPFGG